MQPCPKKNPKKKQPLSPKSQNKNQPQLSNPRQRQHKKPWCLRREPKQEAAETASKTYLKAMPLKELADIENVKNEVKNGNIIILRVTPLAGKSIDEVKTAVNQLYEFAESVGGDIARLGEERVVICPKNIRIWREKTPGSHEPVSEGALPTAA